MPVSRQDLLEVLLRQDKIANMSKDIAGTIVGRQMKLPEIVPDPPGITILIPGARCGFRSRP